MAWNIFKKKSNDAGTHKSSAAPSPTAPEQVKVSRTNFPVSPHALFLRPLATEKSRGLTQRGVYAFHVKDNATKLEIKKAFSNLYGVMPTGVRVMNVGGKTVQFGRREGKRKDNKKALITVPKGASIDIS